MAEEPEFRPQAKVSWCAQDIMDQYQCTQEEAEAFLEEIEDDLQLAMIATGWRVIHGLSEFPRRVGESGLTLPPHIVLQFRIGF